MMVFAVGFFGMGYSTAPMWVNRSARGTNPFSISRLRQDALCGRTGLHPSKLNLLSEHDEIVIFPVHHILEWIGVLPVLLYLVMEVVTGTSS